MNFTATLCLLSPAPMYEEKSVPSDFLVSSPPPHLLSTVSLVVQLYWSEPHVQLFVGWGKARFGQGQCMVNDLWSIFVCDDPFML